MSRAIHVFRTPDRFIAGTVGEPGDRSFYLQAVHEARVISVLLEKQQVQVLADRMGLSRERGAGLGGAVGQAGLPFLALVAALL